MEKIPFLKMHGGGNGFYRRRQTEKINERGSSPKQLV